MIIHNQLFNLFKLLPDSMYSSSGSRLNKLNAAEGRSNENVVFKVHKNENFFGSEIEFCTISLLVILKY
jgi:hypothetical protein